MVGFQQWVEAIISSKDSEAYRSSFSDSETASMWQSLMYRMDYKCGYCMAVCPAGEEVKPVYLQNKKEHVERVLKPLRDRKERVYVMAGSNAEKRAGRNPHKELRIVPGVVRFRPQVSKEAEA